MFKRSIGDVSLQINLPILLDSAFPRTPEVALSFAVNRQ
ncbi:hypothetical protein PAMC26577_09110 [Caballeronia sordidicola]|uniref:Uncharacterized protein n=1 Tax=Caballeronia sordidicola TaxID=196367 RepID=A0A242N157_CABSO|nr:hypothetical protein PAMC26577_09110 [Caballeronia sordidicola]